MLLFIKTLLMVHILSGVVVLATGLWQIFRHKGGVQHRIIGGIYFVGMTIIFCTAIPLCFLDPDMAFFGRVFLGAVSLFSYYFALTAMRVARLKILDSVRITDKWIASLGLLSWLFMACLCIWCFASSMYSTGIILGVFSTIFGFFVVSDFIYLVMRNSTAKIFSRYTWLPNHSGRILGSYIAAITAFCANVQPFPSQILNWLVPTAFGFVLIPYFSKQVKKMIPKEQGNASKSE